MNRFTGNTIPVNFMDVFWTSKPTTVTVTHEDAPYYYLRAEDLALEKKNPYAVTGFPGQGALVDKPGFYKMDASLATSNKEIDAEINFLKGLGLVLERESAFYIYDLAEVFYGQQGYFNNKGAGPAVLSVLYNYVLPGRFWTAYYTRSSLPDDVQPSVALEEHVKEIHDLVMHIVK
jgi:hypothetical protein